LGSSSLFKSEINVQKRGYQFEKILLELARLDNLEVTEGFRVVGEQIDGAFKLKIRISFLAVAVERTSL
jgi:hypothetical protein